ncbi:MAG: hypothetical protein DBP02_02020 [gamma proteobacterium symbiont of Ctena orbiculata]|nr:MAG: hypothetical protein DBP02_02020 [gamma proteobacterium symbiont of Ctena orbiculata]
MQLDLSFQAGLLEQFPTFRDVLRAAAYGCGRPFKHIAADLDMTASKLSRMLADNPNDPINFPADRLPDFIESTGDNRPVIWMAERFLIDSETTQRQAVAQLASLMPQVEALLKAVAR